MPDAAAPAARPTSTELGSTIASAFIAGLLSMKTAANRTATNRVARQLAVATCAAAVALLDGMAAPAIDVDALAEKFAADGSTVDDVIQSASLLFGLAVAHIGITRQEGNETIASAVNRAILTWLTPTMVAVGRLRPRIEPNRPSGAVAGRARLTRREMDVLIALTKSTDSATVCANLVISKHTFRNHLTSICSKLEARNRFEVLYAAQREGLV